VTHRSFLLELTSPDLFRAKAFSRPDILITQATPDDSERCRRLWTDVGAGFWSERAEWTPAQWRQYLTQAGVSFHIALIGREDIGFFELNSVDHQTKLEGFGLLPAWRTHGLGGGLLSAATRCAFARGAKRIWLHTATDDHPNALPNYQARGYRIYHEEALQNPLPETRP
jgi:GNAT superfamily N-acetyltransferase